MSSGDAVGDQEALDNQDDWQLLGGHCSLNCTVISSNRAESLVWIACLIGPVALSLLWSFFEESAGYTAEFA